MKDNSHEYFDLDVLNPSSVAMYNVARLRIDMWHFLRDSARRLHRVGELENPESVAETVRLTATCQSVFSFLRLFEQSFVFPGRPALEQIIGSLEQKRYDDFARQTLRMVRMVSSGMYRRLDLTASRLTDYGDLLNVAKLSDDIHARIRQEKRPYFQILVVDDISEVEAKEFRRQLRDLRRPDDMFFYEMVVTRSFEDALTSVLLNPDIQACLVRYSFPFHSKNRFKLLEEIHSLLHIDAVEVESMMPTERSMQLGAALKSLRPELDLFLVTDAPVEGIVGESSRAFRRSFYHQEDYHELHLSILKAINERYETPFFNALKKYSLKPTGMFHALPISHSATIVRSHWIRDMGEFYGEKSFRQKHRRQPVDWILCCNRLVLCEQLRNARLEHSVRCGRTS